MQVRELMTENPACCSPESPIQGIAKQMVDCDCGEIPVLDEQSKPLGVVTDRDICCRAVALGRDPTQTPAQDVMTSPVVTVGPDEDIQQCLQRMDDNQLRRIPVVDDAGQCCGIVSQADIARQLGEPEVGHVLHDISEPAPQQRPTA